MVRFFLFLCVAFAYLPSSAGCQDNQLTGSLPVDISNDKLVSFRASHNKFTGSITDDIWKLPLLAILDLGSNE
jgi:hypothetical protein